MLRFVGWVKKGESGMNLRMLMKGRLMRDTQSHDLVKQSLIATATTKNVSETFCQSMGAVKHCMVFAE